MRPRRASLASLRASASPVTACRPISFHSSQYPPSISDTLPPSPPWTTSSKGPHIPLFSTRWHEPVHRRSDIPLAPSHASRAASMKSAIPRTATLAWSPAALQSQAPYIATGTVAGALDESFSNESVLELWQPPYDGTRNAGVLKPISSVPTSARSVSPAASRAIDMDGGYIWWLGGDRCAEVAVRLFTRLVPLASWTLVRRCTMPASDHAPDFNQQTGPAHSGLLSSCINLTPPTPISHADSTAWHGATSTPPDPRVCSLQASRTESSACGTRRLSSMVM